MKPVRVPVHLGCCPDSPRCALCGPPPPPPTPDKVAALVDAYLRDRGGEGPLSVSFLGGGPPDESLIDAIDGRPFSVRVRPDLLSRADAERLVDAGLTSIELDVQSFDDAVLRGVGRRYGAERVRQICAAFGNIGLRRVAVLGTGLPGMTYDHALRDAVIACDLFDAVRIHPALALSGARLEARWHAGAWAPASLGATITVCRAMVDVLEANGLEILRIGVQPGPDEVGRAVAGPVHSSLRELVESRRALDHLRGLLAEIPEDHLVEIRCAPADETRTRGPMNQHLRTLRAEFGLRDVGVRVDAEIPRGQWEVLARQPPEPP